jgi:hypothetical protein
MNKNIFSIAVPVLLTLWCAFWFLVPIDITTGDIGRHLKNGEVALSSIRNIPALGAILHTNFYSATNPNFPFINHHWGSGVIFYVLKSSVGFTGLSLIFAALNVAAFWFFFTTARRQAGLFIASIVALVCIPLVADRTEIRPEAFSYLFAGIFIWLLARYRESKVGYRQLFVLPLLMLLWANIHIYFIFGLFVMALFLCESIIRTQNRFVEIKKATALFLLTVIAAGITPFGLKGLLYPFTIFKNYGFQVMENLPGWYLVHIGWINSNYLLLKIILLLFALALVFAFVKYRKNFPIAYTVLGVAFGYLAWTAVRNYALFGLIMIPVASALAAHMARQTKLAPAIRHWLAAVVIVAALIMTVGVSWSRIIDRVKHLGVGLVPGTLEAGEFFLAHGLPGPVFNDFDGAGYFIYSLFPAYRPFVDNRPEAYPAEFFKEVYTPMKNNETAWRQQDSHYGFNSILFTLSDRGGQDFILRRINDMAWAPVFLNKYNIIFVRRTPEMEGLIKQYEIPKSRLLK